MSEIIIKVQNVMKQFPVGKLFYTAVKDVSLELKRGEVVMILGPSGSGKTTLLSMIGCILSPSSGIILMDNRNVAEIASSEIDKIRKSQIGFVFQSFNLLKNLTVEENVEVALNLNGVKRTAAKQKAREILSKVGLENRLNYYPKELSGGERQRVSIARSIVNNPEVILADEPTGSLDSKRGQQIAEILRKIAKEQNTAVLIVTHDSRIVKYADRILYFEDGIIIREE